MTCTTRYATAVLPVTTIGIAGRPPAAADQASSSKVSCAVLVQKSTAEDCDWQTFLSKEK